MSLLRREPVRISWIRIQGEREIMVEHGPSGGRRG